MSDGNSLLVRAPDSGETVPPDALKMLKLAEQCLERAQSTVAKLGGSPAGASSQVCLLCGLWGLVPIRGSVCLAGKACLKPAMPVVAAGPSPTSRHRRVYSDEGGKLLPFLPPEIFQRLQVVESQSSKK